MKPSGLLAPCLVLLLLLLDSAEGRRRAWQHDEDVAGPIVRDRSREAEGVPAPDLATKANATKAKSIAQLIDEALEQEFPEEKQESIGKNYNETAATNQDVSAQLSLHLQGASRARSQGLRELRGQLKQKRGFHNCGFPIQVPGRETLALGERGTVN
jgi:hypothetical protein